MSDVNLWCLSLKWETSYGRHLGKQSLAPRWTGSSPLPPWRHLSLTLPTVGGTGPSALTALRIRTRYVYGFTWALGHQIGTRGRRAGSSPFWRHRHFPLPVLYRLGLCHRLQPPGSGAIQCIWNTFCKHCEVYFWCEPCFIKDSSKVSAHFNYFRRGCIG